MDTICKLYVYVFSFISFLYFCAFILNMFFSSPGTLGAAAESSCSTSTAIPAEVGGLNAPSGSQPRCATHRKIGDLIGLYSYRDMKIDGHVGY